MRYLPTDYCALEQPPEWLAPEEREAHQHLVRSCTTAPPGPVRSERISVPPPDPEWYDEQAMRWRSGPRKPPTPPLTLEGFRQAMAKLESPPPPREPPVWPDSMRDHMAGGFIVWHQRPRAVDYSGVSVWVEPEQRPAPPEQKQIPGFRELAASRLWAPCPACGGDDTWSWPIPPSALGSRCSSCRGWLGRSGGRWVVIRGRAGKDWKAPRYVRTWRKP